MNQNNHAPRLTMPTVPVTSRDFIYARGADVQATWRRHGWTPPSENFTRQQEKPCVTSQL